MTTNPAFVLRHVGSVFLLIPVRKNDITKSYLTLNEQGAWIWQNACSFDTVKDLVDDMSKRFQITKEEEKRRVTEFCDDLIAKGLVRL
ncbi:MAG: PqqD family protein [Clostridiales Family XIII bacterium]|jgi:hypothetical protein|nr:PqqD family protein [Clostridiales Family XIII bacterium]